MKITPCFVGFFVMALAWAAPRQSLAQTAREKARGAVFVQRGNRFLQSKEFAPALENFRAAFAAVADPKIQFSIGMALKGLARPAQAYEAFSSYLAGSAEDTTSRWKQATEQRATLRDQIVFLKVEADVDNVLVRVDGKDVGKTPLAHPLVLEPGRHDVLVAFAPTPWTQRVTGVAGGSLVVVAEPPPPPLAAVPSPRLAPLPPPAASLVDEGAEPAGEEKRSLVASPWFWTGAVVILAGAAATVFLLTSSSDPTRVCAAGFECFNAR